MRAPVNSACNKLFLAHDIMNSNSSVGLLSSILSYFLTLGMFTINCKSILSLNDCTYCYSIVCVTIGICLVSIGYVYTVVGSIENSVIVNVRVTKIPRTIRVCVGLLGVWNFWTIVFEIWYAISIPGIK